MKRKKLPLLTDTSGKNVWRSLKEYEKDPEVEAARELEFPPGASELEPLDDDGRRKFLAFMGASVALGGLAACRRPEEKVLPYVRQPEELVHGRPNYYATAMPWNGTAIGLVLESNEGRPTKVEGNIKHPDSLGATNLYAQAHILDMYDPDRSTSPMEKGAKKSWDEAAAALVAAGKALGDGAGLAILSDAPRSPTLAYALGQLTKQMPQAKVYRYEAFSREHARAGAAIAFGKAHETAYDLSQARIVLTVDADLFGTEGSMVKQAKGFARTRQVDDFKDRLGQLARLPLSRLYSVESGMTNTGATADHRLALTSTQAQHFMAALAIELATKHKVDIGADVLNGMGRPEALGARAQKWIEVVAKDLALAKQGALVAVGRRHPAPFHALAAAINKGLGAVGRTVKYYRTFDEESGGVAALRDLTTAIKAGQVKTLVVLGGNPAFDAPADLKFGDALKSVPTSVHLSEHFNETSALATWHLNRAHTFEQWSDVAAEDGTISVVQPLIAPLHGGKTDAEVLDIVAGKSRKAYDLVRETWIQPAAVAPGEPAADDQAKLAAAATAADKAWRRAVHEGVLQGSGFAVNDAELRRDEIAKALKNALPKLDANGWEVTFDPDFHAYDGRYANVSWLQEIPEPFTKVTWGNFAAISPTRAKELGVVDGDLLAVSVNGAKLELPAVVMPGQADGTLSLSCGQGRKTVGVVGKGVGWDVYPLRASASPYFATGAQVSKTGGTFELARTQEHFHLEGRPLIREGSLTEYAKKPDFQKEMGTEHPPLVSPWQEKDWSKAPNAWGMSIDLNQCVGCNACVAACQAENNIPVVGPDGVKKSREMHWIRIDRYFEGAAEEPRVYHQPMMCVHCENAPCEQVCPVGATAHSPEGTNDMTYNRCVGTRYCANNCPWKVRRFNFFHYTKDFPEVRKMQFNPDVTVRSRGVMEKCTYCIQRINEAKVQVKLADGPDAPVPDGAIMTACQQVCPADAIVFGNLNDKNSRVSVKHASPRAYKTLEELNTKPRTAYLARIRNTNPELENA